MSRQPPLRSSIEACTLPHDALLRRTLDRGAFTDCFCTHIARTVRHDAYVEAFYTSPVFKIERKLLAWVIGRPSTDAQARELALGHRTSFAAWKVEAREANQLLLSDFQGRTCSWLMSVPAAEGESTALYFGSAVLPSVDRRSGQSRMGFAFRALLGFHNAYSRVLLRAAAGRVLRPDTPVT